MSQLLERMTSVLWLALASYILTLSSTEQQGEYSAHLASQMIRDTWRGSRGEQKIGSGSARRQGRDKNSRETGCEKPESSHNLSKSQIRNSPSRAVGASLNLLCLDMVASRGLEVHEDMKLPVALCLVLASISLSSRSVCSSVK